MEFACKVAGAKVILVMGHTACGAIKGAIDKAQLGKLTGLVAGGGAESGRNALIDAWEVG